MRVCVVADLVLLGCWGLPLATLGHPTASYQLQRGTPSYLGLQAVNRDLLNGGVRRGLFLVSFLSNQYQILPADLLLRIWKYTSLQPSANSVLGVATIGQMRCRVRCPYLLRAVTRPSLP